jgi:hypothetical protein
MGIAAASYNAAALRLLIAEGVEIQSLTTSQLRGSADLPKHAGQNGIHTHGNGFDFRCQTFEFDAGVYGVGVKIFHALQQRAFFIAKQTEMEKLTMCLEIDRSEAGGTRCFFVDSAGV